MKFLWFGSCALFLVTVDARRNLHDEDKSIPYNSSSVSERYFCNSIQPPPDSLVNAFGLYKKQVKDCLEVQKLQKLSFPLHDDHEDHDHDEHEHGHHHEESSGILIWQKIGSILAMLVTAILGCLIPLLLHQTKMFKRCMTYVNSFACGAFLGLAFFHLLPEALYMTEAARLGYPVGRNWYNLIFPLSFIGFILILVFEKVLLVGVKEQVANLGCQHSHCEEDVDKLEQGHAQGGTSVIEDIKLGDGATTSESSPVRHFSAIALLATLSLSVHSVFEGIVVGTFDEGLSVWIATLSIAGHKWAAGFALASNCVKANMVRSFRLTPSYLLTCFISHVRVVPLLGCI